MHDPFALASILIQLTFMICVRSVPLLKTTNHKKLSTSSPMHIVQKKHAVMLDYIGYMTNNSWLDFSGNLITTKQEFLTLQDTAIQ